MWRIEIWQSGRHNRLKRGLCIVFSIVAACRKTTGALKIIHERYDKKKAPGLHEEQKELLAAAAEANEQLRQNLGKIADDLHPLRALVCVVRWTRDRCWDPAQFE
jgi:hypothetical protein